MRFTLFALGLVLCGLVQGNEIEGVKYTMEEPPAPQTPRNDLERVVAKNWREGKLKPAERATHFDFLMQDEGLLITNWNGRIEKLTSTPKGWKLVIQVSPHLQNVPKKGVASVNCEFYETYEITGKTFKFVSSEHTPQSQHFVLTFLTVF